MVVDLGLTRIARLVPNASALPWKAIHVAGTNGKGSVCAYIASALHASGVSTGRFNSPHLLDRWDSIQLNNAPVSRSAFLAAEADVHALNARLHVRATEFELLTATAFELFARNRVQVGVVEVGLGGRLDATNVLSSLQLLVTVITKIGLDHVGVLGHSLGEIAREKAGIVKSGAVCVVDGSNESAVVETVRRVAAEVGAADVRIALPEGGERREREREGVCEVTTKAFGKRRFDKFLPGSYQPYNLACAVAALAAVAETGAFPTLTAETVQVGIAATRWPGRLDWLDVSALTGVAPSSILVDGAHNPQAAAELVKYVDAHVRQPSGADENRDMDKARERRGVCWVFAASAGKDADEILAILLQPGDSVVATEFGSVDGMPWVKPVEGEQLAAAAKHLIEREGEGGGVVRVQPDPSRAVREAWKLAEDEGAGVVVAGSLYLVAEVMRAVRGATTSA